MAPSPKKSDAKAYPSEVLLQPSLKSCLVNLPTALTSILVNVNTAAQDVIVELAYRQPPPSTASGKQDGKPIQKSVYLGWTGMPSKRKSSPLIGRDGLAPSNGSAAGKEHDIPIVEIDSTFGKLLGFVDGQKVGILLHSNPSQAHTVNIEPLTPTDWEIIELHADFLEINLLSQIRALPNPTFKSGGSQSGHPLTLHLSPTTSASIIITSISPSLSASIPVAKISPNAEVIVAPKTRAKQSAGKESKSVNGGEARSSTSTTKTRSRRNDATTPQPLFLRGVDRLLADQWFDNEEEIDHDAGLRVWVDWNILNSKDLRGVSWVMVSIVRPVGLHAPLDPQRQGQPNGTDGSEDVMSATSVVARIHPWEDAPNSNHVALSSQLCVVLDAKHMMGDMVRIEAAPTQLSRNSVRTVRVYPFASPEGRKEGLQFGGRSRLGREEAASRIGAIYGNAQQGNGIFEGPLTDGMVLPAVDFDEHGLWEGGLIKFDPQPESPIHKAKSTRGWLLGSERRIAAKVGGEPAGQSSSSKLFIEVMGEIPRPASAISAWAVGEPIPASTPIMVGIDRLIGQLTSHIKHGSSILLTGGRGSGRTSLCHLLASHFRKNLHHITYFPCRTLVTEESRVSAIKDTLNRLFGLASWGARNAGHALVILDDIDTLCPVETELQTSDNGKSRHVSEIVISMVRQYCSTGSRVILLASAKGKEEVNNVIIGGHVVRDIVSLSAPDKETRRDVLESIVAPSASGEETNRELVNGSAHSTPNGQQTTAQRASDGFEVDPTMDFLDLAGQTDGYMPGDLLLLVSRARSEALIRTVSDATSTSSTVQLTTVDFTAALKGFTPSSLRNVTLQHSSTTFSSIGGLRETRQILLETLQYPTLYAPIFAKCPLRLRSGLLLYGYPGCGKTLLASAVAGECGLNFISVKGPEILNKYIGASEKSVRDLFERAQAARPCVLFFDEFDSVAPKRGHDSTGVTDRVVNQLLTQMDGAEGLSGVYVLAATSRPDLIDPALLRPGRLDKSLLCEMPDYEDRLDILRALSTKLKISRHLLGGSGQRNGHNETNTVHQNLNEVARRTGGYSGADLQAVIYNAHLEAIHDVLGDRQTTTKPGRENTSMITSANGATTADFTYFRLGANAPNAIPLTAAVKVAERAKVAAQVTSHRQAQQKRAGKDVENGKERQDADRNGNGAVNQDPVIEWVHIERSLEQTRASISREERRRLAAIYKEFVVGRNGEMPSGQGGSEIGGRSSLM